MGMQGHMKVVRRHLVALLVSVVVFPVVALVLSKLATPVYTADAELFVSLKSSNTASDLNQGATYARDQMASYATLATSPVVLQLVITELRLPYSTTTLERNVSASVVNNTVVLELTASDPSPRQAARIAGSVADQLIRVMGDVAPLDSAGRSSVRVAEIAAPRVPQHASAPKTVENVVIGVLLGLLVGGLYAWLRESMDTRVRDAERVAALTDAPILGSLAAGPGGAANRLPVVVDPRGQQAETFRHLATSIEFLRVGEETLTLLVSSALPGEGKSRVACNLALALAELGHRVLLVDADLRLPAVADRLGLEGTAGLSTVLLGRARFEEVRQEWGPRLDVLTAGAVPPNPVQLLSSPRMAELMDRSTSGYDVVIVDAPPVLPVSDALVLARYTAGTLLVAHSRKVRRTQFADALASLARVEARLLGVVMNMVADGPRSTGYGYGTVAGRPRPWSWLRRGSGRPASTQAARGGRVRPPAASPSPQTERPIAVAGHPRAAALVPADDRPLD